MTQPPRTEAALQKRICKAILLHDPDAWIHHPIGNPWQMIGIPDLLVCSGGRLFALEIKHQKPGESLAHARGRATEQQHHQIGLIRQAGGVAGVVTSVEEAMALITDRETDSETP